MVKISELPPVLILEKGDLLRLKLAEVQESSSCFSFRDEKSLLEHLRTQNFAVILVGPPFGDHNFESLFDKIPKNKNLEILVAKADDLELHKLCLGLKKIWVEAIDVKNESVFWAHFLRMREKLRMQMEIISLRHQLHAENKKWEASKDYLEHHNSELMQFTHTVAHDLNHPLGTIISYMDLLHDMLPADDGAPLSPKQIVERIQRSSNRLVSMIRGMLRFANNTSAEETDAVVEVNLNQTLDSILEDLDVQIQKEGAQIKVLHLPAIIGSQTQIYQVFLNLISNAIKFRKDGRRPEIEVSSDLVSGREVDNERIKICRIYIKDNGRGIPPESLGTIFTPFSRIDAHGPIEGTGVGLATVKRIVSSHAGSIQVESQFGVGTTFTLSFPIRLVRKAIPYLRKELRIECLDERMIKSVMLTPGQHEFELRILNESDNGLCCQWNGDDNLQVGSIIEVSSDKKYQVRWTRKLSNGKGQLGLKVVQ